MQLSILIVIFIQSSDLSADSVFCNLIEYAISNFNDNYYWHLLSFEITSSSSACQSLSRCLARWNCVLFFLGSTARIFFSLISFDSSLWALHILSAPVTRCCPVFFTALAFILLARLFQWVAFIPPALTVFSIPNSLHNHVTLPCCCFSTSRRTCHFSFTTDSVALWFR